MKYNTSKLLRQQSLLTSQILFDLQLTPINKIFNSMNDKQVDLFTSIINNQQTSLMKNINLQIQIDSKQTFIKSPLRNTSKSNFKLKFASPCDIPILKNFTRAYRKQIELPINFETSIFMNKSPQRCLQHNNPLTRYCVSDKKALCENCMYKTLPHITHEVIALNKANNILKSDYKAIRKNIDQVIQPMIKQMIKSSQNNLQRIDKDMKQLITTVTKFYDDMYALMNQKKIEQIKYYQDTSINLKNQYGLFAAQFLQVDQYLNQKLKEISERNLDDHVALNHSVLTNLAKLDHIITPEIKKYYPFQFAEAYNKISEIMVYITNLFNFNYKIVEVQIPTKDREVSPALKKRISMQRSKKLEVSPQKNSAHKVPSASRFSAHSIISQGTFTPRIINQRSSSKQIRSIQNNSSQKKIDNSTKQRKKMFQAVKEYKNQSKVINQKKII